MHLGYEFNYIGWAVQLLLAACYANIEHVSLYTHIHWRQCEFGEEIRTRFRCDGFK